MPQASYCAKKEVPVRIVSLLRTTYVRHMTANWCQIVALPQEVMKGKNSTLVYVEPCGI